MVGIRCSGRAAAALVGLLIAAGACTAGDGEPTSATSAVRSASVETTGGGGGGGSATQPFGSGCPNLPDNGAGSLTDLSDQDWVTALGNIPALAQLSVTTALAGLGDDLSSLPEATVFAPTDATFRALGVVRGRELLTDPAKAADVLRYHVVPGRLTPETLAGSHPTLASQAVEVTGKGENFTVNAKATIICGNLHTQNATLYLIDQVLQPS